MAMIELYGMSAILKKIEREDAYYGPNVIAEAKKTYKEAYEKAKNGEDPCQIACDAANAVYRVAREEKKKTALNAAQLALSGWTLEYSYDEMRVFYIHDNQGILVWTHSEMEEKVDMSDIETASPGVTPELLDGPGQPTFSSEEKTQLSRGYPWLSFLYGDGAVSWNVCYDPSKPDQLIIEEDYVKQVLFIERTPLIGNVFAEQELIIILMEELKIPKDVSEEIAKDLKEKKFF
jgi:hypothetical protein